jgi:hypothetical protein
MDIFYPLQRRKEVQMGPNWFDLQNIGTEHNLALSNFAFSPAYTDLNIEIKIKRTIENWSLWKEEEVRTQTWITQIFYEQLQLLVELQKMYLAKPRVLVERDTCLFFWHAANIHRISQINYSKCSSYHCNITSTYILNLFVYQIDMQTTNSHNAVVEFTACTINWVYESNISINPLEYWFEHVGIL